MKTARVQARINELTNAIKRAEEHMWDSETRAKEAARQASIAANEAATAKKEVERLEAELALFEEAASEAQP